MVSRMTKVILSSGDAWFNLNTRVVHQRAGFSERLILAPFAN